MLIIGIDPGPEESGYIEIGARDGEVVVFESGVRFNKNIEADLMREPVCLKVVVIEMVASYGMAVGASVFRTCVQIGRFEHACGRRRFDEVYRADVKLTLCGNKRAKDTHIKQAIVDMFGGKEKAIGGNKCKTCKGKGVVNRGTEGCIQCEGTGWLNPPGPLLHVKSHAWSALAVALTYAIQKGYLSPSAVNPGGLCRSSQPSSRDYPPESGTDCPTRQDTSS